MKQILIILLLFLIPLAQAEPLATSYWGYVTVDSATKTNALVTVFDHSGKEVARSTSTKDGYQVTVPWDDLTTQVVEGVVEGETLTFKVDGKTATSKTIDPKGTNNRLDLTVTSSSSSTTSSSTTTSSTTTTPTTTPETTASSSITASIEATTSPTAVPQVTAIKTEKEETPTATAKNMPGFGIVLALAGLIAVVFRKRGC